MKTDIEYIKSHAKSRIAYGISFYNTYQQRTAVFWYDTEEEAERAMENTCSWTDCSKIGRKTLYLVQCNDDHVFNRWRDWVTESEMIRANEGSVLGTYYTCI